ncbi:MAG: FG-GAP-like repeat-containing protein [Saprospiraceae bacterium]
MITCTFSINRGKSIMIFLSLLFFYFHSSGQFSRIVGARGLNDNTSGNINGHAWGDVDADGDLDVIFFSAGSGSNAQSKLFINSGAPSYTFTDVTSSRIAGFNDFNNNGRQMLIVDFNNDGYNDILRGFGSSREVEIYYNDGPPNYTFGLATTQQPDVTIGAPGDGQAWNTEGICAVDWNQDGWLDLIIDNDNGGNDIWENDQSGGFTYISPGTGVGQTGFPASHSGDGDYMTAADIDNDGYVDLYGRKTNVTNYWHFNSATSQFETQANPNIVSSESDKGGTMFCDFDNDGDLDLFWTSYGTNQVWRNDGGGVWTATGVPGSPVNTESGIDGCDCGDYDNDGDNDIILGDNSGNSYLLENTTVDGSGLSFSTNNIAVNANVESVTFVDFDNDGDLDLYFIVNGGENQLWENSTNDNNYLYVNALKDLGGGATRNAIGANVFLINCYGDTTTMRTVSGGKGHGSQHQPKIHFGLNPDISYNVQVHYVFENGSRSVVTKSVTPSNETNQEVTILDTDEEDAFYCSNNDGDNVINLIDIDDDNDGILDDDERNICRTPVWTEIAEWTMNSGSSPAASTVHSDAIARDQNPGPGWDSWSIPSSALVLNSTNLPQSEAEALSGDFYVEYTILPGAGKVFDVTLLTWGWNDYSNSPKHDFKVSIYSLTDNYTTPLVQEMSRPNDTDNYIWQNIPVDEPFMYDLTDSLLLRVYLYELTNGIGGATITNGSIFWDDFSIGGYHQEMADCDGDGVANIFDLDSDNDGIYDGIEAGHGEALTDGVVTGTLGANGYDDALETSVDSGVKNYTLADSDADNDYDPFDWDSDNDGCYDVVEAGHTDANTDGVLDGSGVDLNGRVTGATTSYTGNTSEVKNALDNTACCDVSQSGFADNDGDNYADEICDLDDDNDGILDLDEQNCGVLPPGGITSPIVVLGGTPITTIYTNFGDFWESSVGAISGTLPNTTHELLAFTAGGVTYTTDVPDDDLYDTNGNGLFDSIDTDNDGTGDVAAVETSWQAFSNINEISSSGKVSLEGALNDGDPINALGLTVVNDPATDPLNPLLTNGVQGLDLGTGIANVNETWYYSVEIISPAAVGDGVPDLVATQVAQPSGTTYQVVTFYDASWSPVGNAVRIETTGGGALANQVATYNLDLYNANGSVFGANSTRPIRMASFELSEFGITPGDVGLIANMSIEFSSGADAAFVAYNESSFGGLCVDVDTDGDGDPDHLDNDSDNDGCFDAIEAAENFNLSNVNGSGELLGAVDAYGVPILASGGQAKTADVIDDQLKSQCACAAVRTNRHISRTIKVN